MTAVGSLCTDVKGFTDERISGQVYGTGQLFSLYSKWVFYKSKTKPVPIPAHK